MMKKFILALFIGMSLLGHAQKDGQQTILTVGNEKISLDNFVYIYNKNNSRDSLAYSEKSLNEYMELFIKYKLKVKEAEDRKMDTLPSFIAEFDTYRSQLKKPYLTAKGFEDKLIKEAYERTKVYVNTSHILLQVDEFASPEDTVLAFNKIVEIRKEILNGKDFGEMAIKHSEDPSSKDPKYVKGYKGYLGYNAAFSLVYPYEKAAIKTKVGEISQPVRTRFGYHLIKVNGKTPNTGKIQVAHIMIEARDGISRADSTEKHKLALELYNNIVNGADWEKTCLNYSSDKRSAPKGGALPPFAKLETRNLPQAFEDAAFAIENIGDVAKPVKTNYGWHIIKLLDKTPLADFETMKPELKKKVKSSSLFGQNRAELIKDLKVQNNFKMKKSAYKVTRKYADSTLHSGNWKPNKKFNENKKIFSIEGEKYTLGQFFSHLESNQSSIKKTKSPEYTMELALNKFADDKNYQYEEDHLAEKYVDYRMLVQEYRDGILLFDLMKQEVWDKASKDTAGIRAYYEAHKQKYPSKKHIIASIYKSPSSDIINSVQDSIKAGFSDNKLKRTFNKTSQLNLQIESKEYEKSDNEIIDVIDETKKEQIIKKGNYVYLVVVDEIVPAGIKPLKKCKGLVISDYQEEVEELWIEGLKKKFPAKVNDEALKSLVK